MRLLLSLLLLLSNNLGCGSEPDQPDIPTYSPSPESTELKKKLATKASGLLDMGYEDYLKRFDIGEQPLTTTATSGISDIIGEGYDPTSYEDYLKRFTPEESELMTGVLGKYQGLLGEDYGTEDYSKTEQDYLESVLGQYKGARSEAAEPLRERYIAEGLYESGPGFQAEREFGEETAEGVADITKEFAYEGIQRKQEQQKYQDALKRGDYSTMYNLALSEEQRKQQPVQQATQAADTEKRYYDALERGDMQTAFNMAQLLKAGELQPIQSATAAETSGVGLGSNIYGQLSAEDIAKYQAAMQGYSAELQAQPGESDLGGLGSGLGMLAGLGLTLGTGGTASAALLPALIGGGAGGGIGSMIKY